MNLESFAITGLSGVLGFCMSSVLYKSGLSFVAVIWGDMMNLVITKGLPALFTFLSFYAPNEKWIHGKYAKLSIWTGKRVDSFIRLITGK